MKFSPGFPCFQRWLRMVTPTRNIINFKNRAKVLLNLGESSVVESKAPNFLVILVSMLLLASFFGCATSTNYVPISSRSFTKIEKLLVEVDMAKEIDYFGYRLDRSMWIYNIPIPIPMASLVEKSVRYNADNEIAKQVGLGEEIDFTKILIDHLREDLIDTRKVRALEVVRKGYPTGFSDEGSAHLNISIPSWGIRRMHDARKLKTYLDANLEFNPLPGHSFPIKDQQVISMDAKKSFDEYKGNKELLRDEILDLIAIASKRIVSVIIR